MSWAMIPNEAELNILNRWLESADNIRIRLFTNNITIAPATVLTDFTEGAWDNYAAVDWVVGTPATDGAGKAAVANQTALFIGPTTGGAVTTYGWYVTVHRGGVDKLWMCKNWDSVTKTLSSDSDVAAVVASARMYDAHQP